VVSFSDFVRSGNQTEHPALYDVENHAFDRDGLVQEALRARAPWAAAQGQASETDAWWRAQGADHSEVMSTWTFDRRPDLEAVLRMELPEDIAGPWLDSHPTRLNITYGHVLFAITLSEATRGETVGTKHRSSVDSGIYVARFALNTSQSRADKRGTMIRR
jgi:hypothetical protein